jgi:septum site-determining protein MinD
MEAAMGESLVITSGKGGSGKSTVAVNLGAALAARGQSVVLVDMDMGMRSLDVMCGLENRIVYDLADVAEGLCRVKQAILKHPTIPGLSLVSAAQTRGSEAISPQRSREVMEALKERFDLVVIDCPAGVGRGFRNAAAGADRALIVSTIDPVSLRDAERVSGLLARYDILSPLLALNRVRYRQVRGGALTAAAFAERLGLPLVGMIPEDASLPLATAEKPAVCGRGAAGLALLDMARRIAGEDVPLAPFRKERLIRRIVGAIRQ